MKTVKFYLIYIASFFIFSSEIKAQANRIFSPDSLFRYFSAFQEPDSNWYTREFDDSAWIYDTASVGFGEDILRKLDPHPSSLYLRLRFNIIDKAKIKYINFAPDYDDGFIAYLNGNEIARVNVNKDVKFPKFDDLATLSHENEIKKRFFATGIYLDSLLLDSCLVNGENIIAVHVLNDSIGGSDLVFLPFIYNLTNSEYYIYSNYARYKRLVNTDSASIPLILITTDEFGVSFKRDLRTTAWMGIVDNGPGKYNYSDGPYNVYDGNISVELHGQSSRDFPKQTYRFELVDSLGRDSTVQLLGMPKESDWMLYGPFTDRSQIRNKLVFELGSKLGSYQPRSRFCELVFNGQSVGLYYLMENIKRDKNRVNISKLKETDISGIDVTGGYILKYDKGGGDDILIPETTRKEYRRIMYPRKDDLMPEQLAYITEFIREYDSILLGNAFFDKVHGFRKIASDSSLVDNIIINELSKNCDAYSVSSYFYKDREDLDNRIKFGPLWDFDLAFGNAVFQEGDLTYGWQFDYPSNQKFQIRRIFEDTSIVHLFQARWHELRNNILSNESIFSMIDEMVTTFRPNIDKNYYVWPIIDKIPWSNASQYPVTSYEDEISKLKSFIADRTKWIDENIGKIYYPPVIISEINENETKLFNCSFFPNPFEHNIVMEMISDNGGNIRIELYNMIGQMEFFKEEKVDGGYNQIYIDGSEISNLSSGVYIVKIFNNNVPVNSQKLIKK